MESPFEGDDRRSRNRDRIAEPEGMVGGLTMELEGAEKASALRVLALRRDERPF